MRAVDQIRAILREIPPSRSVPAYEAAISLAIAEIERLNAQIDQMRDTERDRARTYAETYQRNSGNLKPPS